MNWNEFYQSVKEGRFERVYLFAGPEELSKREALVKLRERLLPAGLEQLNDTTLENCTARDIIEAAETLPVMCERRVLVVRNWTPLTSRKARNEKADVTAILEWMQDAPETCVVVFYMTEKLDEGKELAAALMGRRGYVAFTHLSGADLTRWCDQKLRPMKKRIAPKALTELSMMANQDLTRMLEELKKLAVYIGDAEEIGIADVQAVVTPSPEYSVFAILDYLLAGRLKEATEVANTLVQNDKDAEQKIGLFAKNLRIYAHMKYAMEAKSNMAELLKALNVQDKRAYRIRQQIGSIPADVLKECYLDCIATSYDIRSGRLRAQPALHMLMLKIVTLSKATKAGSVSSKR